MNLTQRELNQVKNLAATGMTHDAIRCRLTNAGYSQAKANSLDVNRAINAGYNKFYCGIDNKIEPLTQYTVPSRTEKHTAPRRYSALEILQMKK